MAYCTQDDLLERVSEDELIQATDDENIDAVDESKVTRAIADADAIVNGYCGRRYAVPFTTVPALIRKFSVDIALYTLFSRRAGAGEEFRQHRDDAVSYLKGVARGENTLGENDPDETPASANTPNIVSNPRIFSRTSLEGF